MGACVAREHPLKSACNSLHALGHNEQVGRAYKETLTIAAFLLLLESDSDIV